MQRRVRLVSSLFSILAAVLLLLGTGCFPELPLGAPGYRDYQAIGAIDIPGGVFNAAALNTRFEHEGFSIDTKVGSSKSFKMVYNTGSRAWHANWEISYDGTTFVDQHGTVHGVQGIPFGSAIKGTYWVVVDGDSVKTKGGLTYHFDASGRLATETWSIDSFPQLAYNWGTGWVQVEECVSLTQQQAGQCRLVATISYGPDGPMEIVDEVSGEAGQTRRATYAYDSAGMVSEARTSRQDANGLPGTRYEYGTQRLVSAQVFSDDERVEYTYAQTHLIQVLQVGEENPLNRFDYYDNSDGTYTVVHTSAAGGRTRYTFTGAREVTQVERLDLDIPEVMTVVWHPGLSRPSRITHFDGSVRQFPSWVDDDSATIIEPSGNTVLYSYEPNGVNHRNATERPIAQISDDLGSVLTVAYDPATGLPNSQSNGEGETTTFSYLAGNLVSTTSPWGDTTDFLSFGASGQWRAAQVSSVPEVTVHRKFDLVGNEVVPAAGLQRGGVLERAHDRDRRLASMEVAATDENGLVTSTDFVNFALRGDGQPLAITRPLGADHEFEYDALGRTRRICERVEGACRDTTLEYNALGQETALERPNGMREEFDYDPYGRPTAHRAFLDTVLYGEATIAWANSRIVSTTDSIRNETQIRAYEPATGRLQSEAFTANGEARFPTYDVRSRVTRETFIVPPPVGMGDPTVLTIGYDYDLADRVVRIFVDDGSPSGDSLREWVIQDGRIVEVRDGNGNVREALFDAQTNRVVGFEMTDDLGGVVEDTTITRSVEIGPTRFQVRTETITALASTEEEYWLNRPGSLLDPNGKVGMRVFRARGWDDGVLAHDRSYGWDALSNVMDNPAGDSFAYNADRTRLNQAGGSGWSHTYQYDEAGYVTNRDGLEIAWTATGRVERVGPAVLPLAEATWDLSGGIVSVTADGEMREFTYFGGRVERDSTTGGPGWLHIGNVSLPFVGSERRYRHNDFRGNASVVADEAGAIVSHRRYHAFGLDRMHGTSGSGGSSMLEQLVLSGFAGGVAAQGLALSFNGARVLDTDTGRFFSPDPLLQILGQVSYVDGNPILFEDRDGNQAAPASSGVSASLVFGALSGALTTFGNAGLFVLAVGAFNAAGVGASTLSATAVAVSAAFPLVVFSAVLTVGSVIGTVVVLAAILRAAQATIDAEQGGQDKVIDMTVGNEDSRQGLGRLGLGQVGALHQRRRTPPSGIAIPPPADIGITPCSPIEGFKTGGAGTRLWLELGALAMVSAVLMALRAPSSERCV